VSLRRSDWASLALGTALAALIGVAALVGWPLLNPDIVEQAPLDPSCDLRLGPCESVLPGGGRVWLSVEPRDARALQPLRLEVRVSGLYAHGVEVDFKGVDMRMGYNRPRLARDGDRYTGETVLAACRLPAMRWEARVLVRSARGLVAAPFPLEARRPDAPEKTEPPRQESRRF
jgi:hypothetical protein